jgi:hypothetical protein
LNVLASCKKGAIDITGSRRGEKGEEVDVGSSVRIRWGIKSEGMEKDYVQYEPELNGENLQRSCGFLFGPLASITKGS